MAKGKAVEVKTGVNPIVAAMLQGSNRASFGERVLSATVDVVTATTLVTGRLFEAVNTDRFSDGSKSQRFLNLQSRSDYWKQFGAEHGLSDEDVAAIIAS